MVVESLVETTISSEVPARDWDWDGLNRELGLLYPSDLGRDSFEGGFDVATVVERATADAHKAFDARIEELGEEILAQVERSVILSVIDNKWRDHLAEMDYLRQGIGLRAMGQRDPFSEFQREGFAMFQDMVDAVRLEAVRYLFHVRLAEPKTAPTRTAPNPTGKKAPTQAKAGGEVGRNEPCPCGSGQKYKRCHGAVS